MELLKPGYARVSQILSIFQAYSQVRPEKLKKAQDIGTHIHTAIEEYFDGTFYALTGQLDLYFSSFLKWVENQDFKILMVEKRFYDHELRITGRIDLLADINGEVTLIDFKTGSWAHREIWKLQATFYRYLIGMSEEYDFQPPNKFIFVQLQKDGSAPIAYEMTYEPSDWNVCESALTCYQYFCPMS